MEDHGPGHPCQRECRCGQAAATRARITRRGWRGWLAELWTPWTPLCADCTGHLKWECVRNG